jgi:hypothetical protein
MLRCAIQPPEPGRFATFSTPRGLIFGIQAPLICISAILAALISTRLHATTNYLAVGEKIPLQLLVDIRNRSVPSLVKVNFPPFLKA